MQWHYIHAGSSAGPVQESALRQLAAEGALGPDDYVWRQGEANWRPLREHFPELAARLPMGTAGLLGVCASCQERLPHNALIPLQGALICGACKPTAAMRLFQGHDMTLSRPYAHLAKRFAALLFDWWVAGILLTPFTLIPAFFFENEAMGTVLLVLFGALGFFVHLAYSTYFVGRYQATPGKMAMRLLIIQPNGERISYKRALGRAAGELVSGAVLYLGYLMAYFDPERRTLHDHMAGTRVIER